MNTPPVFPWRLALSVAALALLALSGAGAWLWAAYPGVFGGVVITVFAALAIGVVGGVMGGLLLLFNRARWAFVAARLAAEQTRAQTQMFPLATNVSWHVHDSSRHEVVEGTLVEEAPAALPPGIPTFAQLLDQGQLGAGRPLLLGYRHDTGEAIAGDWNSLYSVGVGGMTGSGKSFACAFLIAQSAAAGARLIVIDPHAGDAESLSNRIAGLSSAYLCDVASTPTQIESALKLAADKLARRIAGQGATWPLLLICDEWTSLLRGTLGELLTATALDYAEQGRKFGCYAMLAAQAWQVDAAGAVRDRLASHYCLRTRGDQFRYQLGLRGSAPVDSLFLKQGEAYFLSTRGELAKVVIPKIAPDDLAKVGALIDQPAAAIGSPFGFHQATPLATTPTAQAPTMVANGKPDGSLMVATPDQATTAPQSATSRSPEAARAAALFVAGSSPAEVVKELRGVSSSQGRAYQAALNEVLDLIRQGMGGGA